jgi:hypothetical protein
MPLTPRPNSRNREQPIDHLAFREAEGLRNFGHLQSRSVELSSPLSLGERLRHAPGSFSGWSRLVPGAGKQCDHAMDRHAELSGGKLQAGTAKVMVDRIYFGGTQAFRARVDTRLVAELADPLARDVFGLPDLLQGHALRSHFPDTLDPSSESRRRYGWPAPPSSSLAYGHPGSTENRINGIAVAPDLSGDLLCGFPFRIKVHNFAVSRRALASRTTFLFGSEGRGREQNPTGARCDRGRRVEPFKLGGDSLKLLKQDSGGGHAARASAGRYVAMKVRIFAIVRRRSSRPSRTSLISQVSLLESRPNWLSVRP